MGSTTTVRSPNVITKHIRCEILRSIDKINTLEADWRNLSNNCPEATVFQTYEWNIAFCRSYLKPGDYAVIIAREHEKIVGIAPFMIKKRFGINIVEPIGGDAVAYYAILAEGERIDVLQAMAKSFCENYPFGVLQFPYHAAENRTIIIFYSQLMYEGWRFRVWMRNIAHFISNPGGFNKYLLQHSAKSRHNIRYERKRWERTNLAFEHYEGMAIDENVIQRVSDIQKNSWLWRRGQQDINSRLLKQTIDSLKDFAKTEIYLLRQDDVDLAYILNYKNANKAYAIMTGFDERFSKGSPGKYLWTRVIEDIMDRKDVEYDFMFGDGEYKRFWCNRTRHILRSVCWKGSGAWFVAWFPYRLHGIVTSNAMLRKYAKFFRSYLRGFKKRLPNISATLRKTTK